VKNLRILIKQLIKEYWGEPSDGAKWQQPPGDSIFYGDHTRERSSMETAPPPDKLNKDLFGNEFEDYEEYTIDDYLEKMGLSDKELPGKTYK
jgi:hypothetical protein